MDLGLHHFETYMKGSLVRLQYTNIVMENGPFQDLFIMKHGYFPDSHVSSPEDTTKHIFD